MKEGLMAAVMQAIRMVLDELDMYSPEDKEAISIYMRGGLGLMDMKDAMMKLKEMGYGGEGGEGKPEGTPLPDMAKFQQMIIESDFSQNFSAVIMKTIENSPEW
jgi:hypothetical protein